LNFPSWITQCVLLVLAKNKVTVRHLNLLHWNTSKQSSCVCRSVVTFETSHCCDVYSISSIYKLLNFTLWNHAAIPPCQASCSVNVIASHLMKASLIYAEQLISVQSRTTFLIVFNALDAVFCLSLGIKRGWTEISNSEPQLYLVFDIRALLGINYKSFVLAAVPVSLLNATQIHPLPRQGIFLHYMILVRMQRTCLTGTERTSRAHF
jgi:hypothetical protein